MKKYLLIVSVIITTQLSSQNYEFLFFQEKYDSIVVSTNKLETIDDYYWYSRVLIQNRDFINAISTLQKGYEIFENDKIAKLLANTLYNTGQYNKALPLLQLYNYDYDIFIKNIKVLEFYDKNNNVISLLEDAVKTDSLNTEIIELLARNYAKIDSTNLAINYYNKIKEINPNNQLVLQRLTNLYIQNKQYTEAINLCNYVLDNDSTNLKFIKYKGMASFAIKDFQMAEWCFQDLVDSGDSTSYVLKNLGISQYNLNGFDEAINNLSKTVEKNDQDFDAFFFLGLSHLKRNYIEEGLYNIGYAKQLLEPNPIILSAIYTELALFYLRIKDFNKAVHNYQMAYNNIPKPDVIFYIANIYYHDLKNYDKALFNFEKYLDLIKDLVPEKREKKSPDEEIISLKESAEIYIKKINEDKFWGKNN